MKTLTRGQVKAVEDILREIVKQKSYGGAEGYEFKYIDIRDGNPDRPMIFLITEYGRVNDENTMASIFCRDHRVFSLGKNGGIRLLTGKKYDPEGLFHSINHAGLK